jgi:hypothetical protein
MDLSKSGWSRVWGEKVVGVMVDGFINKRA